MDEPRVKTGTLEGAGVTKLRGIVEVPIMRSLAEGARDIGVPEIVIIEPGKSVWEPITKS